MRDLFKGYYKPSKEEFDSLWANAIFVFDTNVLLNLYRYQSSTRDSLLAVIERLTDRVWIPYHVGLEFQRNRLKVIAEQHRRYAEVQGIVSKSVSGMQSQLEGLQLKKRHSHINPDQLLENIEKIKSEFISELRDLEKQSISVTSYDEIREKLDTLFDGKIGSPPASQKDLDDMFKDAEIRYKKAIPPGFEDSDKDKNSSDEFTYGGVTYKRKYGDFIVWKQMINQAKDESLKDVIFITDDSKSDWWWKIDSNGKKTIGVRPELMDEITREADIDRFYVYTTDSFLSYANKYLDADVTDETIEEIREVAVANQVQAADVSNSSWPTDPAQKAVFAWLAKRFASIKINHHSPPDFVSHEGGRSYVFFVKSTYDGTVSESSLVDLEWDLLLEDHYDEAVAFIVVPTHEEVKHVLSQIRKSGYKSSEKITLILGRVESDENAEIGYRFVPYDEVSLNNQSHREANFLELSELIARRNLLLQKYE